MTVPMPTQDPGSTRKVDGRALWSGGLATAIVAALIALVGILVCRWLFNVPILSPRKEGAWGNASTVGYTFAAAACALAAGCLLAACALIGVGLGAIIRHTAGAIAAAVGVIYLLGVFCLILPSPWNTRLGRFTVPLAAYQVVASHPLAGLLTPGLSMLVIIAWPAATLAAAAIVITRRDV